MLLEPIFFGYSKSKITVIFQPHRYSRLIPLIKEFSKSFINSDKVFVSNVYSANEKKPNDFDLSRVIRLIGKKSNTDCVYLQNLDIVKNEIKRSKSDDVYIFLGAGNITEWPYQILKKLNEN